MPHNFGQAMAPTPASAAVTIGTAAANAALNVYHALKVSKLQQKFQKRLENDAEKIAYIKAIANLYASAAAKLASTSGIQPGTKQFEELLRRALVDDMDYKGWCNADIYVPMGPEDKPGQRRETWAKINSAGHITYSQSNIPPDVGPIWAARCKGGLDEARMSFVKGVKGTEQFQFLKLIKEDINIKSVLLKGITGLFLIIVLVVLIKMQRAHLAEQKELLKSTKK